MQQRNIAMCIVLSIVTCGIYGLFWFVSMTNDTNTLARPEKETSGVTALLLTIVTCNIYGIFWAYRQGQLLDKAMADRGRPTENREILYLILELVFPVIGWALMQNTINAIITD